MSYTLRQLAIKSAREGRSLLSAAAFPLLRSRLAQQSPNAAPYRIFGSIHDEFWFWCLTRGLRRHPILQKWLPSVPAAAVQERFTGSSGDQTLREGWRFYRLVKNIAKTYGVALSPERTVLDYGCGWGRIIRFFLKDIAPHNLHGIDCMPEVIELCQQTNRWAQFQLVDPLPPTQLPSQSVDVIYCYSVFSHLAEAAHLQWLAEFKRILKPNGLLIATTRPRQFIHDCAIARQRAVTLGTSGAASAFIDTDVALQRYDAGEFCYSPVGGGDVLDSSFYGETCIPEAYVRREWSRYLTFKTMIDDRSICHQNVIVMQQQ